ncbi:MAG: hypothetical protein HQL93_10905 [Magnetococcales bacterium]|nr:hypothetical protein [Magnetococcales bacterium]
MDTNFFETDLTQLDQQSLEKIAAIAEHAKRSLMIGISTLRQLDETPHPTTSDDNSDQMVEQLSRLTLMWDEIHHRAIKLLSEEVFLADTWPTFPKHPTVTLH